MVVTDVDVVGFVIVFKEKCSYLNLILDLYIPFLDINECVNHTCSNGGSCIDGINNYSCNCPVGFTGNFCDLGKSLLLSLLLFVVV